MKAFLAIILIVVSVGLFFFKINPNYSEIKVLRAQSSQYDDALKVAEELKKLRGELATKLASFSEQELRTLEHFMPSQLDTVRVILDVDGIAASRGIKLKDIKVTSDSAKTAPTGGAAGQTAYNTTSLSFVFNSSYTNAQTFIKDLEQSLRLIDVSAVTIKPPVASGGGGYDFGVTLSTYWIAKK